MNPIIQLDNQKVKAHHYKLKLMGCRFVLTAIEENPQKAWDAIRAAEAEIKRIEDVISSWRDDSQTTAINDRAGEAPVQVSTELFQLIARSIRISEITAGAFDISGTLARYYWNFDGQENTYLPTGRFSYKICFEPQKYQKDTKGLSQKE